MSNSKSSLFLMELIIVILFFSISAAVCVQLFFSAHQTDIQTNRLSHAEIELQNAAECYIALDGNLDAVAKTLDCTFLSDSSIELFFDSDWNAIADSSNSVSYALLLDDISDTSGSSPDANANGVMKDATITIFCIDNEYGLTPTEQNIIIEQNIKHYVPYIAK